MAEQSPSQLINDWQTAAKSATKENAKTIAQKIANFYTSDAVLCATPEEIVKGQSNILNDYAQNFGAGWALTGISNQSINQGTAANWAWAYGQWGGTFSGAALTGCWSILFVNQPTGNNQPNWLIQQHTIVTDLPSQPG